MNRLDDADLDRIKDTRALLKGVTLLNRPESSESANVHVESLPVLHRLEGPTVSDNHEVEIESHLRSTSAALENIFRCQIRVYFNIVVEMKSIILSNIIRNINMLAREKQIRHVTT